MVEGFPHTLAKQLLECLKILKILELQDPTRLQALAINIVPCHREDLLRVLLVHVRRNFMSNEPRVVKSSCQIEAVLIIWMPYDPRHGVTPRLKVLGLGIPLVQASGNRQKRWVRGYGIDLVFSRHPRWTGGLRGGLDFW